jgi:L-fuculose-phosphate aldolase
MNSEWQTKEDLIEIGRNLWTKNFVAANDGNISVRTGENEILTTPTGVSKGTMTPEMIIRTDFDGKVLSGGGGGKYRPSSEVKMHLEVYRARPDIKSVIHAHPPFCTSFAVAGIPLDKCVLPEAIITLGSVPIAPYGTPSTVEIPDSIKPLIEGSDAVLLANHGALTFGNSLLNAYFKMETLEHSAHITYRSIQLGNVNVLPEADVEKLLEVRKRLKIPGRISFCTNCKDKGKKGDCDKGSSGNDNLVENITSQVIEQLQKTRAS